MARRIVIDGETFRVRRGVLVKIPEAWLGQTTHGQTRRKRPSKAIRKIRVREGNFPARTHPRNRAPRHFPAFFEGDDDAQS